MRIKKTSQTTPIQAEVVNTYSESTENAYSANYVNNHSVTVSEEEPTYKTKVWIKDSENIIDINDITTTSYITNNGDGSITLNGTGQGGISFPLSTPFVLKANTTYILSLTNTNSSYSGATFILRNEDTNIIQINYSQNSVSYTPTSDTTIDTIRIYSPSTITFDNYTFSVRLEKNIIPTINVLENNMYHEIYTKDVYSLNEIKTNKKWIDDKPIYQNVIIINSILTNPEDFNISFLNADYLNIVSAILSYTNNNVKYEMPNNRYVNNSDYFEGFRRDDLIRFNIGSTQLAGANKKITMVLEYTKITD